MKSDGWYQVTSEGRKRLVGQKNGKNRQDMDTYGIIEDARTGAEALGYSLRLEDDTIKLIGKDRTLTFLSFSDCIRYIANNR